MMIDLTELPMDELMLLAIEDIEADSGNHEPLDQFLCDTFRQDELVRIYEVSTLIANRTDNILSR